MNRPIINKLTKKKLLGYAKQAGLYRYSKVNKKQLANKLVTEATKKMLVKIARDPDIKGYFKNPNKLKKSQLQYKLRQFKNKVKQVQANNEKDDWIKPILVVDATLTFVYNDGDEKEVDVKKIFTIDKSSQDYQNGNFNKIGKELIQKWVDDNPKYEKILGDLQINSADVFESQDYGQVTANNTSLQYGIIKELNGMDFDEEYVSIGNSERYCVLRNILYQLKTKENFKSITMYSIKQQFKELGWKDADDITKDLVEKVDLQTEGLFEDKNTVNFAELFSHVKEEKEIDLKIKLVDQGWKDADPISMATLMKWAKTYYPDKLGVHVLDPLGNSVLSVVVPEKSSESQSLVFMVNNEHVYPILNTTVKKSVVRAQRLKLEDLTSRGYMKRIDWKETSTNYTYIDYYKYSKEDKETIEIYNKMISGSEDECDGYITDIPLSLILTQVVKETKCALFKNQIKIRRSEIIEFVHPTSGKVIKFGEMYEDRKRICERLYSEWKYDNFAFRNQSYAQIAKELAVALECVPKVQTVLDPSIKPIYDKYFISPLVGTISLLNEEKMNSVGFDISSSYPTAILTNKTKIPVFSVCDYFSEDMEELRKRYEKSQKLPVGCYLVKCFSIESLGGIKFKTQLLSHNIVDYLLKKKYMLFENIKCYMLASFHMEDTFLKKMVNFINDNFTNKVRSNKSLANCWIGTFGKRYNSKDTGVMTTDPNMILAIFDKYGGKDDVDFSYESTLLNNKNTLYFGRLQEKTRCASDNSSIFMHILSEAQMNLLKLLEVTCGENSTLVGYNTDSVFLHNPKKLRYTKDGKRRVMNTKNNFKFKIREGKVHSVEYMKKEKKNKKKETIKKLTTELRWDGQDYIQIKKEDWHPREYLTEFDESEPEFTIEKKEWNKLDDILSKGGEGYEGPQEYVIGGQIKSVKEGNEYLDKLKDMSFMCNGPAGYQKSTLLCKLYKREPNIPTYDDEGRPRRIKGFNKTVVLCYTNKACENIRKVLGTKAEIYTFHKFFTKFNDKIPKSFSRVIIDEYSMLNLYFLNLFVYEKYKRPDLIFQLYGDPNQCPPIEEDFTRFFDYNQKECIKFLCGYNMMTKQYYKGLVRYEEGLKTVCDLLLKTGKLHPNLKYQPINEECEYNLSKYNTGGRKTVVKVNKRHLTDKNGKTIEWYKGMRVMCTKNYHQKNIYNSQFYYIHRFMKDEKGKQWLSISKEQNGEPIEFTFEKDGKKTKQKVKLPKSDFVPAFCVTVYKYQGSKIDQNMNIYDVDKMNKNEIYTAISRCTHIKYVHLKYADKTFRPAKENILSSEVPLDSTVSAQIYRIFSDEKKLEYVGLTFKSLKERLQWHKENFTNKDMKPLLEAKDCKIERIAIWLSPKSDAEDYMRKVEAGFIFEYASKGLLKLLNKQKVPKKKTPKKVDYKLYDKKKVGTLVKIKESGNKFEIRINDKSWMGLTPKKQEEQKEEDNWIEIEKFGKKGLTKKKLFATPVKKKQTQLIFPFNEENKEQVKKQATKVKKKLLSMNFEEEANRKKRTVTWD